MFCVKLILHLKVTQKLIFTELNALLTLNAVQTCLMCWTNLDLTPFQLLQVKYGYFYSYLLVVFYGFS